jgi:uncharacterized protein
MSAETAYNKPLPELLPETAGFWEAAGRHELVVQQCTECGRLQHFPRLLCHRCLSGDLTWTAVSGRGVVYSFTIVRQVLHASFGPDVPYVYAIIELEEGVRLIANVVGVAFEQVRVGMPVKVVFADVTPVVSIPRFEPV